VILYLIGEKMISQELLITLQQLNRKDKLQALQYLANELANEEEKAFSLLNDGNSYPVWSPIDAHEAANILEKMLEEKASNE
jgi:hypothetical protein